MSLPQPPDATLFDIAERLRRLVTIGERWSREELLADVERYELALFQLIILGEAVKRLSLTFRAAHPEIPWKAMAGQRDILIHQYDELDIPEVLRAVYEIVPQVLPHVERLIPPSPYE